MGKDDSSILFGFERLAALRATGLLDSDPEPLFDQVTRAIANLLKVKSAHVSLVDDHRQYLKSTYNLVGGATRETVEHPLSGSYCKFAVAMGRPFIVEDATVHPLLVGNGALARGVIAYAGVPLVTDQGHAIGVLCAIDDKPRRWSEEDIESLEALARSTMGLIEPRIADATRAARAATSWGYVNPWQTELLALVEKQLDDISAYERLLSFSGAVRADDESRARESITAGLERLKAHHNTLAEAPPGSQGDFARLVGAYLTADAARRESLAAFTRQTSTHRALEQASTRVASAEDALRLAVRDLG